jgi:hypothetical protein
MIEIPIKDAPPPFMANDINALGVKKRIMVLRDVLECRKKTPLTPYKFESWDKLLSQHSLQAKYPRLVSSLQKGFNAGIHKIYETFTPPNGPSLDMHVEAYQEIVDRELRTKCYIELLSQAEVEQLISPF